MEIHKLYVVFQVDRAGPAERQGWRKPESRPVAKLGKWGYRL